MKKFIIDIINTDKQKYHDVLGKIKKNFETVQTSHLCLVNDAWYKGYEIFIFDGFDALEYEINAEKVVIIN